MISGLHCRSVFHRIRQYTMLQGYVDTHTHTPMHTPILPGEPASASFSLTLPLHTFYLTPSHHVLLRQENGRQ